MVRADHSSIVFSHLGQAVHSIANFMIPDTRRAWPVTATSIADLKEAKALLEELK